MADLAKFEGEWQEYKSDNLEKFLDATGVGSIKKAIATKVHPTLKLKLDGDTINASVSAGPKENKVSFKLGVPFDAKMELEGSAVATFDSATGQMRVEVTPKDAKKGKIQIVRDIKDGELVQEMTAGDVKCTRYFKKK